MHFETTMGQCGCPTRLLSTHCHCPTSSLHCPFVTVIVTVTVITGPGCQVLPVWGHPGGPGRQAGPHQEVLLQEEHPEETVHGPGQPPEQGQARHEQLQDPAEAKLWLRPACLAGGGLSTGATPGHWWDTGGQTGYWLHCCTLTLTPIVTTTNFQHHWTS